MLSDYSIETRGPGDWEQEPLKMSVGWQLMTNSRVYFNDRRSYILSLRHITCYVTIQMIEVLFPHIIKPIQMKKLVPVCANGKSKEMLTVKDQYSQL